MEEKLEMINIYVEAINTACRECYNQGFILGVVGNREGLHKMIDDMKRNLSEGEESYKTCPNKDLLPLMKESMENAFISGFDFGFKQSRQN